MLSSLRSLLLLSLVLAIFSTVMQSSDAKLLDAMLELFDAPSRIDDCAHAEGHFAEKTIEFLAFGDAAMDYYQS